MCQFSGEKEELLETFHISSSFTMTVRDLLVVLDDMYRTTPLIALEWVEFLGFFRNVDGTQQM